MARVKWLQRLGSHGRPEVAAANADIDHIREAIALASSHPPLVNIGNKPSAALACRQHCRMQGTQLIRQREARRGSQQRVQRRTTFGDIDLVAGEHGIDLRAQAHAVRHRQQGSQCVRIQALAAEVEQRAVKLTRELVNRSGFAAKSSATGTASNRRAWDSSACQRESGAGRVVSSLIRGW